MARSIRLIYAFVKVFSRLFYGCRVESKPLEDQQKGGFVPTIGMVKIGGNLKRLREDRLLTQAELGAAAGVHRDQVSRIERNEVEPRFSTIRKLAEALNVDPTELVKDT
jgi:DNA-binding XRE family transcriptional regulator